ncbi:MAG: DUF177 domain-containing protein [Anaerolineales bacterium]
MLNKNVGSSRNFDFDEASLFLGEDLQLFDLNGALRLTRTGQGVYAQGTLRGTLELECVRCLSTFPQGLDAQLGELFVYPPDKASDPELAISENAILDLTPLLREIFLLDVPMQPICSESCLGLCPECGENLNENNHRHEELDLDPRMAVLKNLLSKS